MRTPLSHSRIELFETCRLKFKALTFDKVKGLEPMYFQTGRFFHVFAAEYIRHLVKSKQESDHAYASALFDRVWRSRHEVKDYSRIPESLHDEMRELCEGFWTNRTFNPDTIIEPELEVALTEGWTETMWLAKDVFFRAKIDLPERLTTTRAKITDFKSGWGAWSKDDAEHSAQLPRYAMALHAIDPTVEEYEVAVDFVRPNIIRSVVIPAEAAIQERKRILAVSDQVEEAVRKNAWPASPGAGCADCPLLNDGCPARQLAAPLAGVNTVEEAVQAFQRLVMIDEERKRITGQLKSWTDGNGPVVSGGQEYGPKPQHSYSYPVDRLLAWAQQWKLPLDAILKNVGKDELERAVRKHAKSEGEIVLASLPEPTVSSKVDYRTRRVSAGEE